MTRKALHALLARFLGTHCTGCGTRVGLLTHGRCEACIHDAWWGGRS